MTQNDDPAIKEALDGAANAIKRGDLVTGKAGLKWVLERDPNNVLAWLWMSRCAPTNEARLECFNRVLAIDPTNRHALEIIQRFGGEDSRDESPASPVGSSAVPPVQDSTKQRGRIALMYRLRGMTERPGARIALLIGGFFLLLVVCGIVCSGSGGDGGGSTSSTGGSSSSSSTVGRGWLCDFDGRGEVALWSKPALAFQDGNEVVDTVGMSLRGCVDVTLLDETTNDGILFYRISVGGQRGWVDVDYYYPARLGKPSWSTN